MSVATRPVVVHGAPLPRGPFRHDSDRDERLTPIPDDEAPTRYGDPSAPLVDVPPPRRHYWKLWFYPAGAAIGVLLISASIVSAVGSGDIAPNAITRGLIGLLAGLPLALLAAGMGSVAALLHHLFRKENDARFAQRRREGVSHNDCVLYLRSLTPEQLILEQTRVYNATLAAHVAWESGRPARIEDHLSHISWRLDGIDW